jgi:signal transduction histidine kinase
MADPCRRTSHGVTLADLRSVDLFDELSDDELEPWLDVVSCSVVQPGELIEEQGEPASGLKLLLSGSARSFLLDAARPEPVGRQRAPTWMGAIAVLTDAPMGVRMQAETVCRVALVAPADFVRLTLSQPVVHRRVMRAIAPVVRRLNDVEHNRERLASLGTMAAGLAHELNNPAAAAQRASAQLGEALHVINAALRTFVEAGVEREDAARLLALHQQALDGATGRTALDALDAADAEDALLEALEELGAPEPWALAGTLSAAGVDCAWLREVAALAGTATPGALRWVAATLSAEGLVTDLQESTLRMSRLVGAVKSYAYMDRGGLVEVDLHEGLESTLVILNHKLKHTTIRIERDYDRTLPKLTIRGSELNQVWTNLLDNAIDALGESGTIAIATRRDSGCALVEISDDGPGIPPELQERVFDSFFTTKAVGRGTGLGLETARRIVVDRHEGSLTLDSEPGRTTLSVRLPFSQS